jgi:hypothetical protein
MKSIRNAFFWLSGAGTEELQNCPSWEQRKYVAFGATVLVPSVFAAIASAYAISTLTDDWRIIGVVAFVWAFIILTVDRALLASYRAFAPLHKKFSQFMLRFVVAILMGVTIAHPMTLLIFRDTIHAEIERDREVELAETKAAAEAARVPVRENIVLLEEEVAKQRDEWTGSYEAKFLAQTAIESQEGETALDRLDPADPRVQELKAAVTEARKPYDDKVTTYETEFSDAKEKATTLALESDHWQKEFEREVNGQRSGIVGLGPRAKSIRDDQLAWRRDEAKRLAGQLEFLTADINRLRSEADVIEANLLAEFEATLSEEEKLRREEEARVLGLQRQVQQQQADGFVAQQDMLRAAMAKQMDSKLDELKGAQQQLADMQEDERKRVLALSNEPRRDLLTQSLALHALFQRGDEGGKFALGAYVVLTLLFMLVDTMPLMVKFFTRPGPYDTLMDRDELRFDTDRDSFIKNYTEYAMAHNDGRLSTLTQHKPLERVLVQGVERSRATVEFLDALFEMEQQFQKRLVAQKEQAEAGGAYSKEKIAMLEDMAGTFYDDLRQRAERFFRDDPAVESWRA